MNKLTLLLGTAAMALTLTTAAQAQDTTATATDAPAADAPAAETAAAPDASTVVATIGGTDITLGEMIIARAQLPQQYDQFPPDVIFAGLLDQIVQQQLLANSLTDTPDRVTYAMNNEERSLRAGEVIAGLSREAVTDEAVQAAYDEMTATAAATPEKEWNASHILVATKQEAEAVQERLNSGEDFAAVATEVSTDPGATNGGELGWFGAGQMVPEFEAAVEGMSPGDVSGPIETQFGWHIVKLNEARVKPVPALDEVRSEIVSGIQEKVILSKIEELKAGTEVTLPADGAFDPAILQNLDLLGN